MDNDYVSFTNKPESFDTKTHVNTDWTASHILTFPVITLHTSKREQRTKMSYHQFPFFEFDVIANQLFKKTLLFKTERFQAYVRHYKVYRVFQIRFLRKQPCSKIQVKQTRLRPWSSVRYSFLGVGVGTFCQKRTSPNLRFGILLHRSVKGLLFLIKFVLVCETLNSIHSPCLLRNLCRPLELKETHLAYQQSRRSLDHTFYHNAILSFVYLFMLKVCQCRFFL